MLVKVRTSCRPVVNGKEKNISVQATCSDLREGLSAPQVVQHYRKEQQNEAAHAESLTSTLGAF